MGILNPNLFESHGMSGQPKHEMLAKIKSNYSLNNPV